MSQKRARTKHVNGNSQSTCGCPGGDCRTINRRDFLVVGGLGAAATLVGGQLSAIAKIMEPEAAALRKHPIPADKNLPAGWLRSLFEKGERLAWSGEDLKTVGMPVGGIGTGQIYLCGDGTLGHWEIFNEHEFIGWGLKSYARRSVAKPVDHGIALCVESNGRSECRYLDATGFSDVSFRGEHPIGTIGYSDPELPVAVSLEAFSPFIPLNAADSALPATIMAVTVTNNSREPVRISLLSWLENPVGARPAVTGWNGKRITAIRRDKSGACILHSAEALPEEPSEELRETTLFARFEENRYRGWTRKGKAFGRGPVKEDLPHQQKVRGREGKGLVNSFLGGDDSEGLLKSSNFKISRRYINFLIGGGDKTDLVGMRLIVDSKEVRKATGKNSEELKWVSWDVSELEGKSGHFEIFDDAQGPWGHVLVDHIEFSDRRRNAENYERIDQFPDFGTLAWMCLEETLPADEAAAFAKALPASDSGEMGFDGWESKSLKQRRTTCICTKPVDLAPGAAHTVSFVLAWHFPNTVKPAQKAGHEYAARFDDACEVADYVADNFERLAGDTRKWRDTWYDSSLPVWLLDRIHLTSCCLATGTAQWWKNGRFWAYEGVVCCEGTCTHVWNYSQSLARLFPELERSVREKQDLGEGLLPSGLVGFRHNGIYAADGQCGTVLKAYREHLTAPDDAFLRRNWKSIRKVLDYAIKRDANRDGLIEDAQHNTYDIDFHGVNTFVGALYLAALLAGAQMANEMGDKTYAKRLKTIYESGKRLTEQTLWNGEYFIQDVDLKKHPSSQYGPGCLSDQLFGQNWAHQTGLGYLYSRDKVRKALESVWKYNWAPDTGNYNRVYPPERPFAEPAEAGLVICTWPKSDYLKNGVRYRAEVWTGIEYQVAAHMIYEGLIEEGLAICRAVHDRYHPSKRNPYNEVECSDFYARAMASWGVLLAVSGFEYHGPAGRLAFAPRFKPEKFRCAFTAAEGWGTFDQKIEDAGATWTVEVRHGSLALTQLVLKHPHGEAVGKPRVTLDGQAVDARCEVDGGNITVKFAERTPIRQGQKLVVVVG